MERLADFRQVFAQMVVARGHCSDPTILAAFTKVPRHEFVGPGPWQVSEFGDVTPSADPALVYQDVGMGLAEGIPTGLPSLHARIMASCAIIPGARVVQVGAGAGYFTAVLSELVGETGRVVAYEIDAALAARAQASLAERPQVRVLAASGVRAFAEPADVIYVFAGAQVLPLCWVESLAPGGRLVFPLTPGSGEGGMLLVRRLEDPGHFEARFLCRVRFVPCIGAQDGAAGVRLAAAFAAGTHEGVRSLRLGGQPDASAWFVGAGWWLSTDGPAH